MVSLSCGEVMAAALPGLILRAARGILTVLEGESERGRGRALPVNLGSTQACLPRVLACPLDHSWAAAPSHEVYVTFSVTWSSPVSSLLLLW